MAKAYPSPPLPIYRRDLILNKLRRCAQAARLNNPRYLGVMASPPTVSATTSAPSGQTNGGTINSSPYPNIIRAFGGTRYNSTSLQGRVKSSTIWTTGGNVGNNDGSQASYSRSEFMADAIKVTARVKRSAGTYRFLVNDQYVDLTGTLTTAATPTSTDDYITLDFTSAGARAVRKIAVECQGDGGLVGAYVGTTESVWRTSDRDIITSVLLGDSYAVGSAATALGDGFGAVMADYLGIRNHMNSGSSGTGWQTSNSAYRFDQRIANGDLLLNGTPDIIFLMGSYNDRNGLAATITANTLAGLVSARAQAPSAIIFVFGTFPGSTGPSAGVIAAENAVFTAVTSFNDPLTKSIPISTEANGVWISGTGTTAAPTGTGNSDVYTESTGVHGNTAGCAFMGWRAAGAVLTAANTLSPN